VLLDTIGELASVYALAAVAFVGGSLIPAGGHNPLEPAQFGVPIVMGPYFSNFRGIAATLLAAEGLEIAPKERLAGVLMRLLQDGDGAKRMGNRAQQVFQTQAGATEHSIHALSTILFKVSTIHGEK
jgi:3-deoxy-D-manno-octulosonic-acid transferase